MAYYSTEDERAFVMQIQEMLSSLARWTNDPALSVVRDGIYGDATRAAVEHFQSERELPVTGNTDFNTWQMLEEEYSYNKEKFFSALGIHPFPAAPDFAVREGDSSQLALIIQLILNELQFFYASYGYIPPGGRYGSVTAEAVRAFQSANGLKVTGEVDRMTWNRMAEQYDMTVRSTQ